MASKSSQQQRLKFIESQLLWEGTLQRRDICEAFGLTPNHVTREITAYRKRHARNLVYDPEARLWRIGPHFEPAYASGEPEEYLALLHAYALSADPTVMVGAGPAVPAEALPRVNGWIDRGVLKALIAAMRHDAGLVVKYQSFSEPEPIARTLWPHALVHALGRWHVRAYDEHRQRFADFVLPRIVHARSAVGGRPSEADPHSDADWQSEVSFKVVPAAGLSASQQAAVVRQFGMRRQGDGFAWKVSLRRCLAKYFLHAHRLDMTAKEAPYRRIALHAPSTARDYRFSDD